MIAPADRTAIEAEVAQLEAGSGVEVVTVVVRKSDVYPETVWKAFALGASLTALVLVTYDFLRATWPTQGQALWMALGILGMGAFWALAAIHVPAFTRAFLRASRAELETRQYADVQFLQRELFATPSRTAVLVLVSMLERRVVIRADVGLRDRITVAEWDAIIAQMVPSLRVDAPGPAMRTGLRAMRELLAAKGLAPAASGHRFGDAPIEVREP